VTDLSIFCIVASRASNRRRTPPRPAIWAAVQSDTSRCRVRTGTLSKLRKTNVSRCTSGAERHNREQTISLSNDSTGTIKVSRRWCWCIRAALSDEMVVSAPILRPCWRSIRCKANRRRFLLLCISWCLRTRMDEGVMAPRKAHHQTIGRRQ
jgi:hypothetical protein